MKRNFYILLLLFSLLFNIIVYLCSDLITEYCDVYYIFCIVMYITLILLGTYQQKGITMLLIFQAPFGLFILGRFIAHYLDGALNLETIDFFYATRLNTEKVINYLSINMFFFLMVFVGYAIPSIKMPGQHYDLRLNETVVRYFSRIVVIVTITGIALTLKDLYYAVSQYGYSALYIIKKENANDSSSMFVTLLLVAIGIVAKENSRSELKILMTVLFFYSFALLLMGARGPMMTYILLWLWLYKKDIKIFKFGLLALLILSLVQFISSLMRTSDVQYNIFAKALYDIGTTFIVLPFSYYITDWPNIALLQNFVPLVSRVSSLFLEIKPYEANLANYLGYYLNQDLYWKGVGLGWSIVADFSIYSNRNVVLLCIFAFFFGCILKNLDDSSKNKGVKYGLSTSLILPLGFLYRSGLFSIVPLAIYFFVTFFMLYLISNMLRRINLAN
ncbi:O-antigen polysaccharide polymerase Wzy [Escherichia coli]|nr:O-antigen polysaccharide polymerase Wzy [Escherichia coli]EIN2703345.1 O-antigen polysaccharide polymerase Wzy [Escherichia coli]